MPDVDNTRGTIHGTPAVMGDYYGKAIGVIDLALVYNAGHWQIDRDATKSEVRMVKGAKDEPAVDADEHIGQLVAQEHQATIAYVKTPIGTTDVEMSDVLRRRGRHDRDRDRQRRRSATTWKST